MSLRLLKWAMGLLVPALAIFPWEMEWVAVVPFATIAFLWFLECKRQSFPIEKGGKIVLGLLLFWLSWGFVSALLSPELGFSLWSAFRNAAFALGGLAAGMWFKEDLRRNGVLGAAIGLGFVSIYCFTLFHHNGKASSPPFFPDTNLLSAAIAVVLPLLMASIVGWKGNWRIWVAVPMVVLLVVAVVIFRSRGAWLSCIAMALITPIFFMRVPSWRMVWLAIVFLNGAAYFGIRAAQPATVPTTTDPIGQLRSIGEIGQDFSNRERLMRWECALRMASDKPLFGHGPGRYSSEFRRYLRGWHEADRISYWFGWKLDAHNDSLTVLAETGWPGGIAFAAMLLMALGILLWRIRSIDLRWDMNAAIGLSLVGWIVHGCFNDLMSNICLAVWGFCLVGLLVFAKGNTDPMPQQG